MAPYFGLKGGWLTFWVTVACATDMTLFGYDQGVFGGVVVTQDFLDTLNLNGKTTLISTVTAIYDIGCFFGAIIAFMIGEKLGRKKSILLGTTVMSIGAIIQIASYGVPEMIVGRWLIARGRIDEAEQILADLEALGIDDPYIITQSKDIQWAVNYEKENAVRWRDLARGRTGNQGGTCTIRRLVLGMGTQAMQQLSGINVTSYYLTYVLIESVGLSNNLARLLAACNSVSYLVFSTIGIPNVERWGRRKMMMYAAAGQCLCYACITLCLRYSEPQFSTSRQWASASIAFFFLYYVFFGIGWQGVPWLYPTECNSLSMRTKGAALGTATNRPEKYIQHEKEEVRRHSSIKPEDITGAVEAHKREVLEGKSVDEKMEIA
ncbi:Sugar transporter STL1 [Lasiodiplodia theobromae]|uniref:Sugar transporter STL1 n=1 Tax=Lasiodiplodia theobromae TaxID=45133 RepID=A0A5N5DJU9_9PEZI|nr:Sugar transporter STL1 [Lasiodiplodia theobromae]